MSGCIAPDCTWDRERGSDYCSGHRARIRRNGSVGTTPIAKRRPPDQLCDAAGCDKPCRAKGLCHKHYSRLQRHGKIEGRTALDRFTEKTAIDPTTGCWEWTGCLDAGGYGMFARNGRDSGSVRAHRAAYELFVGPIPDGMHIDHLCHTHDDTCPGGLTCPHRRCVNPDHLEPVAPEENTRRGRAPTMLLSLAGVCRRNHDPSELTTGYRGDGREFRVCRACNRFSAAVRKARRAAA